MGTYYVALALPFLLAIWMTIALDNHDVQSGARFSPGLNCVSRYDGYVIEFLWILNPQSTRGYYEFSKQMRDNYMPDLLQNISQAFPGSRAGIATYGALRDEPCYTLIQPLTNDMSSVVQTLKKVHLTYGGASPEFSLLGMALAASDPNVGWSRELLMPGKNSGITTQKRVIKVLCLSTDDKSHPGEAADSSFRKPLTGTGSDTCVNASPSPAGLGKILNQNDVSFVGLVTSDFLETWQRYFTHMQVTGNVRELRWDQFKFVLPDVMDALHNVICPASAIPTKAPKATTPSDAEHTSTSKGGNTVAIISGASAGAVALVGTAVYLAYRYFSRSHPQGGEEVPEQMIDVEDSAGANNREQAIVSGADAEHYR